MVQTFKEYQLGNHCGHVSYEELEKACFGYIQNIAVLEKRLEIACHIKADDKVGFDFAVLDKIDSLERERDEAVTKSLDILNEYESKVAEEYEKELDELEADNAMLKKQLENFRKLWEWVRFTDKYHFCEDNGIRIEDMERKEG